MQEERLYLRRNGYLLGQKFSSGTFSTIHLCLRISDGARVAVKLIDLRSTSYEYRKRFLTRELANVASLHHPNIIKVHNVGRSKTKAYIIMDYAYSSLHVKILHRHYVGEEQARVWFKQLTSALEYLYMKNVAHRDIKIENILLDEDQNIKLCDFGFSKVCEKSSQDASSNSTTFCGSLGYCAPEILMRTPYDPLKTDIWSLGVVLYKLVIGGMPFGEGNDLGSVRRITKAQSKLLEFPMFPKTSIECKNLIRSLLTVETTNRITLSDIARSKWVTGSSTYVKELPNVQQIPRQPHSSSPLVGERKSIENSLQCRNAQPPFTNTSLQNTSKQRGISRWLPSLSSKYLSYRKQNRKT